MIVRTLKVSDIAIVFETSVSREIVAPGDKMGHLLFDTTLKAGTVDTVKKSLVEAYSGQAHYCLSGEGTAIIDGKEHSITPGTVIAVTNKHRLTLQADSDMRICTVFGQAATAEQPVVRTLNEILGTERDVFWGNGRSRRLLIRKDGFDFAFCITLGHSNTDSPLQYKNHFESCYYVSGTGEYVWGTGSHPIDTSKDQSTVFIMNENDAHRMVVENESICLSIFTPAIEGHEAHNFAEGASSSY